MDMRVKLEFLIPGVQHAEEADLRTEVFWITCDLQKRFRAGAKQEIVDDLLILQGEWRQLARQCEDHMYIARREKLRAPRRKPAVASTGLTLRTVPVAARVVGDGAMSAAGAFIKVAAERGSATPRNGQQHFDVLPSDPLTASIDESVSRGAD